MSSSTNGKKRNAFSCERISTVMTVVNKRYQSFSQTTRRVQGLIVCSQSDDGQAIIHSFLYAWTNIKVVSVNSNPALTCAEEVKNDALFNFRSILTSECKLRKKLWISLISTYKYSPLDYRIQSRRTKRIENLGKTSPYRINKFQVAEKIFD